MSRSHQKRLPARDSQQKGEQESAHAQDKLADKPATCLPHIPFAYREQFLPMPEGRGILAQILMNIEGTYTLQAPSTEVWHALLDTQLLQQTVPSIERLEQVSEYCYAVVFTIKHAPLKGTYQGQITLSEQQYPSHYRLAFEGKDEQGAVNAVGSIHLHERNATTVITYKGTLTYSKRETLLPPKLVKGAAKLLIQQFFTTLATQFPAKEYKHAIDGASGKEDTQQSGWGRGKMLLGFAYRPKERRTTPSIFSKVIHLLRLGAGDEEQVQRWEQLLRTASILSGFLLLVWIGTRLPSRK